VSEGLLAGTGSVKEFGLGLASSSSQFYFSCTAGRVLWAGFMVVSQSGSALMQVSERAKTYLAVALFAVAGFLSVRFFRSGSSQNDATFFYDLSEQKLFTAPRTSVPPIRGVNDFAEDAVRAVVISTNGNPADKTSWTIAYLEKYSAELKAQIEAARASGGSPGMSRGAALGHRFIRRLSDTEWFAMNTAEAEKIVAAWATPGPNGITPVVCSP
jgi:hypothetical protein